MSSCNYGDQESSILRGKFVIGITDLLLKEKRLGFSDLTLRKAIEIICTANTSMPPQSDYYSSLGIKIHRNRGNHLRASADLWLKDKKEDDGAEGLWRIHDDLYDINDYIHLHPGGSMWLELTKGTDITEAFEAHHITTKPENMLHKFHVRKAKTPRNSPFTFHEDGFYRTLKKRIREVLPHTPTNLKHRSKVISDLLLLSYLGTSILATTLFNYYIGAIAGIILAMLAITAHNFFHQKDSFRMYYFDLSMLSSRDWRISHVLSHHLYPNTIIDLEIQLFEPLMQYLPRKKSFVLKYVSWIYSPIFYITVFSLSYLRRLIRLMHNETKHMGKADLLPFIAPVLMYLFSGQSLGNTIIMWLWITSVGSFHFTLVGVNAAHHGPHIFHDGDEPRSKKSDWGIAQLDAVMDRHDINWSYFLILTNFGDHGLHHLFPSLDHGVLSYLHPVFDEVCAEFNAKLRVGTQLDMVKGQFQQLANDKPNTIPYGQKTK